MEPIVFKPGQTGDDRDENKNQNQEVSNQSPSQVSGTDSAIGSTEQSPAVDEADLKAKFDTVPVNNTAPADDSGHNMPNETPAGANEAPQAQPKKSKRGLLIAIALSLVLIAGLVFAYLRVNKLAQPAVTTADESERDIAELRLGSDQYPFTNFYPNPNFVAGGSFSSNLQMYEGLVGYQDASKIVPLLAESWTNPDEKTWVFELKSDVKFHNGETVTAEDVRRSIDMAVKDENTIQLLVSTIASVSVQDENHVVIKTKEPDAILLNKLPYLFVVSEEKLNGALAGTGAYMVDPEHKATEKELRLTAFDDHHLGRPSVRKITYLGFESEEEIHAAVKESKVDITDFMTKTGMSAAEVEGYQKESFTLGDITYIGINAEDTTSPLNKLAVRQALRLAIDPADFMKQTGRAGNVPTQMTVKANFGYNPELEAPKRDVARAKQLLAEAGYPNGVSLRLHFYSSEANKKAFAVLKSQAAEAGITLLDDGSLADDAPFADIDSGETQLYYLTSTSALVDSYDLFAFNFRSENFNNDQLNKLLDQSNTEFDANKRKILLQEASKVIVDQVAAVPLVENVSAYFVKDGLNYQIDPAGYAMGGYIRTISAAE